MSASSGAFSTRRRRSMGATVETDARQQALLRRIEELAARAGDDLERPEALLSAALTGLRAELGGLRAEIGSLRAEFTTVRAGLDTTVGRLAGDLAAARAESTDLARRQDDLAAEGRGAIEGRLAAVEDSLDTLAEGLEALTRDSIGAATDRIGALEQQIASLADTAFADQASAQEEWAAGIRAALADLAGAVDRNLGSLGTSLTDAVVSTQETGREHVEHVERTVDRLAALVEGLQASTDGALGELRAAIAAGMAETRAALVEELGPTIADLEQANAATRQLVEDELTALRGDLADALEEVRDRVATAVTGATDAISGAVDEQRSSFDAVVEALRSDVLAQVTDAREATVTALEDVRADVTTAAGASEDASARLGDVESTVVALDAAITQLRAEWTSRTEAVVSAAERAGHAATAEFRTAAERALAEVRDALEASTSTLADGSGVVSGAANRLVKAGQSLLGYLAERDVLLENERDRVLHDLLDAFGEGISAKERRWVAGRLQEAFDRRRDERDAQRWRRSQEETRPALDVPTPPDDLAALAEPVQPRRRASSRPGSPPSLSTPPTAMSLQDILAANAATAGGRPAKAAAKKAAKAAKKAAKKSAKPAAKKQGPGASGRKKASAPKSAGPAKPPVVPKHPAQSSSNGTPAAASPDGAGDAGAAAASAGAAAEQLMAEPVPAEAPVASEDGLGGGPSTSPDDGAADDMDATGSPAEPGAR